MKRQYDLLPIYGHTCLERLWQTVNVSNCSSFTLRFMSAGLYLCVCTESHIRSGKSESQVADYPIFIYKGPSAFPTVNRKRSQVMHVMDLVSTIKEQLRKQVRLQAVQLLHTDPGILTDTTSVFLPIQSWQISLSGTSLILPNPTDEGRSPAYIKSQPLLSLLLPTLHSGLSRG